MSFTQEKVLKRVVEKTIKKKEELEELESLRSYFPENERTQRASTVAFSERLEDLRRKFEPFFSAKRGEVQS